jgi:uncharacterized protein (DUF58 family)
LNTRHSLVYRTRWRSGGAMIGAHRASTNGPGHEYHRSALLTNQNDARRLDLKASVSDLWERTWVRLHRQSASIPVVVLADVSASMLYRGRADRHAVLIQLIEGIAKSAWRIGDSFSLIACDQQVRHELFIPTRRSAAVGHEATARMRGFVPDGRSAAGLIEGLKLLPRRRALVFVISDFHFPLSFAETLLRSLGTHDGVPVILSDSAEPVPPPCWGLGRVKDLESGKERMLLLRPDLTKRAQEEDAARKATLRHLMMRLGCRPLWIEDGFDPLRFNRHFAYG